MVAETLCEESIAVTVETANGRDVALALQPSGSLMKSMRDAGLPILADCGGACACATCHVYVDAESLAQLPAMGADEAALLSLAEGVTERSRLSCQIPVDQLVAGMRIELAPGAHY